MTRNLLASSGLVVVAVTFGCTANPEANARSTDHLGSAQSALSADQCDYFQVGGKTRICHATGSAKNPYVILNVSDAACVSSHAAHPADYVAVGDATCNGQGCLPEGAPSDPTIACCDGLTPTNGTCQPADRCLGVTCYESDQCYVSSCDSATGQCVRRAKDDGSLCDDGAACTLGDACVAGTCSGSQAPNGTPVSIAGWNSPAMCEDGQPTQQRWTLTCTTSGPAAAFPDSAALSCPPIQMACNSGPMQLFPPLMIGCPSGTAGVDCECATAAGVVSSCDFGHGFDPSWVSYQCQGAYWTSWTDPAVVLSCSGTVSCL
jgi:hypothetical protein